jgi:hypothetical protein
MLQRRGTFNQWDAVKEDLVLQAGEIGLETNTGKFKIGNGTDDWATLDYIEDDGYNLAKYARIGTAIAPIDQTLYGTRTLEGKDVALTTFVINVPSGITADYIQSWKKNGTVVAGITKTGGAKFTDDIDMSGKTIKNLPTPSSDQDAASKAYVDEVVAGLAWKEAAHLFANSNVSREGTTGTLIIDGHDALVTADSEIYRIVLNGQTVETENGIYVYTDNGATYTLERATDALTADQLQGASIYVQEGTTYGTSSWVQSNYNADTFDELIWVQFSGAALITDGAGLLKDGNTLSVIGTANRISVTPDNVDIDSAYVGQTSITTLGTVTSGIWEAQKISIEKGGTGSTTAVDARSNLGITPENIGAAPASHNHDDLYYTETESDAKYAKLEIANSFTKTQTITSTDVNEVPVTVKAASSQTAALTSWKNSSNSQIASVDSNGIMTGKNFATTTEYATASSSVAIDFASTNGTVIVTATGNLTFSATNYTYYAGMPITVFIKAGASARNFTFPSGWVFLGPKPTGILSGKTGVLTVVSTGTTESDCVASWISQL